MSYHRNLPSLSDFNRHHLEHNAAFMEEPGKSHQQMAGANGGGPTWLNNALLRQQAQSFLHLQETSDSTAGGGQWPVGNESAMAAGMSQSPPDGSPVVNAICNVNPARNNCSNNGAASTCDSYNTQESGLGKIEACQNAAYKAQIIAHPLYEQLLSAHVACLRIATPVDQLQKIDAQLAESQHVLAKYSVRGQHAIQLLMGEDKELDQFMTHYFLLLCSFKEQLEQHVRVHAMEAVMGCWELEQSLQSLTGVSAGEGTGGTMSDDEDEQADSDANLCEGSFGSHDSISFGPLVPTENERSLMERVRQELKHELKQGYKEKIADIRDEILRKRRAGKLPGDTTSLLKSWWQSHSKWPYPTEDDKARLVQETGLQLKQINNWFINQRKRNWHSNPSSAIIKTKRKSDAGENNAENFV